MTNSEDKFRPNVCVLLYNSACELLLGERLHDRGHWQFPQGGVDEGDELIDSVVREIREELGIERSCLGRIKKLSVTHSYVWTDIPEYAVGRWIGQSQTFWAVEFIGEDSDIDLTKDDTPEFQAWRWCSLESIKEVAASKRWDGYEKAIKAFKAVIKE
jgi:putative (di)nucleoside polyphosphate hydrolase